MATIGEPIEAPFDFGFLDNPAPIGQDEAPAFDYNAVYGFDPAMDLDYDPVPAFDFNADFQRGPSLPMLPDATATTGQSLLHSDAAILSPVPPKNQELCKFCHKLCLPFNWYHDNYTIKICSIPGCNSRFHECRRFRNHLNTHSQNHHEVWDTLAIACAECNERFEDETQLRKHANDQKHSPYTCSCGVKFARNDVLIRHIKSFTKESAKYPCTLCKRHRGKAAFRRRDHLVQHLQGYHKMEPEEINDISPPASRVQSRQILSCLHLDCAAYRDDSFKALPWKEQFERRPFQKQSDYNKHMREVHQESAFSCPVGSCDRVGAKGYMREKDLLKHLADKHSEASSSTYVPTKPSKPSNYRCAGCGKRLSTLGSLQWHEERCQHLRSK
ncbi:hypothetical protein F5Y09DRAFT_347517 [Xylaria sp. FL1042]|nr:hypothetical protein F5Y09DRAFT_347517 [Xylaria sp. FL1042]